MEPVRRPFPSPARILRDAEPVNAVNGFIALLFAGSAPVAIILGVGTESGLSRADLESWIFAAFAVNGLLTIALSLAFRMPLAFFWTIPGTVLLGSALDQLTFAEVIGAFHGTALLLFVLGVTGSVRRIMAALPMPIVMAMVAGVFVEFGLDWIGAMLTAPAIALPMTAAFFLVPLLAPRLPAMLAVLVAGVLAVAVTGQAPEADLSGAVVATPDLYLPAFSLRAMVELVVPLAVTVIAAQNAQGIAVLTAAGHRPPVDAVTAGCGVGSFATALFGSVSTCLTGPSNAILVSSGAPAGHYVAALVLAVLAVALGILSPVVVEMMLATPPAFVAALAGLALLRVLEAAFRASFSGRFTLGALVTFLVTVSGLELLNVGAPFWGLVFGALASLLAERADFRAREGAAPPG